MFPSCLCCSSLAPAFRSLSEILGKGRYIHAWHHLFLKWLWQTFKRHLECGLSPALLRQTRDIQRPLLRLHDCWHHDMWLLSTAWTQYQLANSLLSQNNQFRCFFSHVFVFLFKLVVVFYWICFVIVSSLTRSGIELGNLLRGDGVKHTNGCISLCQSIIKP